jgi:hypothetical protein
MISEEINCETPVSGAHDSIVVLLALVKRRKLLQQIPRSISAGANQYLKCSRSGLAGQ